MPKYPRGHSITSRFVLHIFDIDLLPILLGTFLITFLLVEVNVDSFELDFSVGIVQGRF